MYESAMPRASRWDGENGTWQGFAVRKWYTDILEVILGISVDGGGITVGAPYLPYELSNFVVNGKSFCIKTQGNGKEVECIVVNGKTLHGILKIPYDLLCAQNEIIIVLGKEQRNYIQRFTGVQITEYSSVARETAFSGYAYATKGLFIKGKAEILQDGYPLSVRYFKDSNITYAKVKFIANKEHSFIVRT